MAAAPIPETWRQAVRRHAREGFQGANSRVLELNPHLADEIAALAEQTILKTAQARVQRRGDRAEDAIEREAEKLAAKHMQTPLAMSIAETFPRD
jgi:prephenate dehydrogenase